MSVVGGLQGNIFCWLCRVMDWPEYKEVYCVWEPTRYAQVIPSIVINIKSPTQLVCRFRQGPLVGKRHFSCYVKELTCKLASERGK